MPFAALLGGIILPVLIYLCINIHKAFSNEWRIPTAADIAFSLEVASLFGKRIPVSRKIFLLAIAIIDDLAFIIVIAQLHKKIKLVRGLLMNIDVANLTAKKLENLGKKGQSPIILHP